ncbi:MAG: 2-alkenal reductase [Candidatus Marinimicrobia bacterium]|nr:2-alkenal reductase [Candidatus Neomarinimicrobiota bacterium]|tara:strand:+ start:1850 stop:2944 length:1095 start_codon:yes stop_codon:yes gene_type:complete
MIKRILFFGFLFFGGIASLQGQKDEIKDSRRTAISNAVEEVSPSVVGIHVTQLKRQRTRTLLDPFWGGFFPHTRTYKVESMGSGLIVSPDGYIVTNAHVTADAHELIVTLAGGQQYNATIIGQDELTDIALLKIDITGFTHAPLGNSDDLIVGEWAIAIGNPLGLFDVSNKPTASLGIISGLHMDFGLKESGSVYQDMIQTDASINQGNSGGPLVNALGQIIGINTFIMTGDTYNHGSIGIGFAIPINMVKDIAEELKQHGRIERNFTTGVHVQKVDPFIQRYLKLPTTKGVIVTDIEKNSSGERAGLETGDIILEVNERLINSRDDILRVIDESLLKVGDEIELKIWRNDKVQFKILRLAERK